MSRSGDAPFWLVCCVALAAFALACAGAGYAAAAGSQERGTQAAAPPVYRVSEADLQEPELPTGCEATAGATLLRLNGIEATKAEVADAMPRGENWVHEFWGDPYDASGWAIMAPGMAHTLNKFLGPGQGALDLTGGELAALPTPCQVWVTVGLEEPRVCAELEGYRLMDVTHCMTVLFVGEYAVHVIDPLEGERDYPRAVFEQRYVELGRQAIYIATE